MERSYVQSLPQCVTINSFVLFHPGTPRQNYHAQPLPGNSARKLRTSQFDDQKSNGGQGLETIRAIEEKDEEAF
jgi:hypothetical protein